MITVIMLIIIILSGYAKWCYANCRYAKCHYTECHYSGCRYAKWCCTKCCYAKRCLTECRYAKWHCTECLCAKCFMLSGVMLSVSILSDVMLSGVILRVVMLSGVVGFTEFHYAKRHYATLCKVSSYWLLLCWVSFCHLRDPNRTCQWKTREPNPVGTSATKKNPFLTLATGSSTSGVTASECSGTGSSLQLPGTPWSGSQPSTWGQSYKTFSVRDLRIFVLS